MKKMSNEDNIQLRKEFIQRHLDEIEALAERIFDLRVMINREKEVVRALQKGK